MLFWFQEKQTKLWHTPYYDNEQKLKQLYMKISKNLPAYDCKLYSVKELVRAKKRVRVIMTWNNIEVIVDYQRKS